MYRSKYRKKLAVILAVSLFALPTADKTGCYNTKQYVQAKETFADALSLYQYWCEGEEENYPDNVGEVYVYYYGSEGSTQAYDPQDTVDEEDVADFEEDEIIYAYANSMSADTKEMAVSDTENQPATVVDAAADVDYVYVIGLVNDTPEAEEAILSRLENKNSVAFTSCAYSHKELKQVNTEIVQMMTEEEGKTGIVGVGITCGVSQENGVFTPMKAFVDVSVLTQYYETMKELLIQKYGDKVEIGSVETTAVDTATGCDLVDDVMDEVEYEDEDAALDIGAEISSETLASFLHTTTAMTLGSTFTFQADGDEQSVSWSVKPKKKAAKISAKGSKLSLRAKKTGYITITAKLGENKTLSQKVLILDKKGTVSTQKQLMSALTSDNIKKITIKTSKKKNFTIPSGDYGTKKIVVNAPNSKLTIKNQTLSKDIVVKKLNKVSHKETASEEAASDLAVSTAQDSSDDLASSVTERNGDEWASATTIDTSGELAENDMSELVLVSFDATILEIDHSSVSAIIEPDQDAQIRSSGDRVMISYGINTRDNFSVGDRVRVTYDGDVAETYPLQIKPVMVDKIS